MTMKPMKRIDEIMQTMPDAWRRHWCGGENGPCACLGCVQIGNRLIMVKTQTGNDYRGDPEYIDETKIEPEIYADLKVTKEEWLAWKSQTESVTK